MSNYALFLIWLKIVPLYFQNCKLIKYPHSRARNIKETVAKRIKGLREQKGFSQEEIADRLNISRSAYERMENGKSQSWATHLGSLAEVFEVTPEYFVKESPNKQENNEQQGGLALQNNGTINTINYLSKKLVEQYEKRIALLEKELKNKKTE